ncbi:MAG: hypothetical protein KDE68_09715 [Rhodocyclaceae bacterium]|nr:hypothetical protein [Rhodocyclaceae bacterium]
MFRHRLLIVFLSLMAPLAMAGEWHFAIIGDSPYSDYERRHLPGMLADISVTKPAFILHVGDIKSGTSYCSDEMYADRLALFNSVPAPLIYTPGDNEWTDCHRLPAGSFEPTERLAHLRKVFFSQPRSLGSETTAVRRQSDFPRARPFPENLRWEKDGIVFATLNIPGSDNNLAQPDEHVLRALANTAWLDAAFFRARVTRARALVLVIHADLYFNAYAAGTPKPAYRDFLDRLRRHVLTARHPTVLVHGDSHRMTIDQPLLDEAGKPIAKFTRIESYGYPFLGWVRVTVPANRRAPLRFTPNPWSPGYDEP